jgi:DNA-binding transcriptional LysR family regulator
VEWDDVRVLLAVLRARNLEAAGARLGLSASTVSRRLSALEKATGARLFARTREGLLPTEAAERLRRPAEGMEAAAAALDRTLGAGAAAPQGTVRVATTDGLARVLVHEGLLLPCDEHAGLEIEVISGNHPVDLARGDADLAVRLAALKQPSLRARCVAAMPIALFAAPAYLRAHGTVRGPAGLSGHDVLIPSRELGRLPEARWLAERPGVRVAFRSNSMPALVAAASRGRGIVPLPLGWGDSDPSLCRLFVLDEIPKRKVWVVTHEAALERPAVHVVAQHITAIFERTLSR